MTPRVLTKYEHETIPIGLGPDAITTAEAEVLAAAGRARPGFCQRGYGSVKLAQYCGLVSLGGRVLEVLPKIDPGDPPEVCQGILFRMLRLGGDQAVFRHLSAGAHIGRGRLLESFIAAFLETVARIVRRGLLRRYIEHEQDISVVRGGIQLRRQVSVLANRPDVVACRFDELTADNVWNRLLKLGLHTVKPWIETPRVYREWSELMAVFEEVDHGRADVEALDRLVFDRHASRYRDAVRWVRWIVRLLRPTLRGGGVDAPALLFDMNTLFESAVARAMAARGASLGLEVSAQDAAQRFARVRGSGRPAYQLKPDLVILSRRDVVAIGDTKWKRLVPSPSGILYPGEADMYQMAAYATAYGCGDISLIYPSHAGARTSDPSIFELQNPTGATVTVTMIDVGTDALSPLHSDNTSVVHRLLSR